MWGFRDIRMYIGRGGTFLESLWVEIGMDSHSFFFSFFLMGNWLIDGLKWMCCMDRWSI